MRLSRTVPDAHVETAGPAARVGPEIHGSLRAVGAIGALPALAPGVEIALSVQWNRWFGTALGLSLLPEQRTSERTLAFGLSQLWLAGCAGAPIGRARADGCMRVAGGLTHAYALGAPSARPIAPGSYGTFAIGPTGRLAIELFRHLRIDLEISALIGVIRPEFELVATPVQRWQSAPVMVFGSAGLGF